MCLGEVCRRPESRERWVHRTLTLNEPFSEINPFYGEFLFRLECELLSTGQTLCVCSGREENYARFLLERNLEGAIVVGLATAMFPPCLEQQEAPIVLFDSYRHHPVHRRVLTDELRGGALAAEFLLNRNRKQLVFLGDVLHEEPVNIPTVRFRGACRICDAAGLRLSLVEAATSFTAGRRAAARILELKADGVVAAADVLAAGLIRGLQEAGAKVPEDVAVVGYDDLPLAQMVTPPLTTIHQGLPEKIREAVALLKDSEPGEVRIIKPHLAVRASA